MESAGVSRKSRMPQKTREASAPHPARGLLGLNLKFTGLTHNFSVDPAVCLRIPIRDC
jgi:hypothetical protein